MFGYKFIFHGNLFLLMIYLKYIKTFAVCAIVTDIYALLLLISSNVYTVETRNDSDHMTIYMQIAVCDVLNISYDNELQVHPK